MSNFSSVKDRARFGTAGWSFPDWEGVVYPRGIVGERLSYVAEYVDLVEINTTFYRPANPKQSQAWLKQVESRPNFTFAAKLWQKFTHERAPIEPLEARAFMDGVEPLIEAGRLAALVFQFPWSFRKTDENILHIERLHDIFAHAPQAIEVRHASWDDPQFMDFLRKRRIAFVNVDQPPIRDTLRPTGYVTAPFGYVRLHGRNKTDWFREGADRDDRYNYLYSNDELEEWSNRIGALAADSETVYVVANNHFRGQAFVNALEFKNRFSGSPVSVPESLFDFYPRISKIASNPPAQANLFT